MSLTTQVTGFVSSYPDHPFSKGVQALGQGTAIVKEKVLTPLSNITVDDLGTFVKDYHWTVPVTAVALAVFSDRSWWFNAALSIMPYAIQSNKTALLADKQMKQYTATGLTFIHAAKIAYGTYGFFNAPVATSLGMMFDALSILKHADLITSAHD